MQTESALDVYELSESPSNDHTGVPKFTIHGSRMHFLGVAANRLAAQDDDQMTVRVLDPATGETLHNLDYHQFSADALSRFVYSPDQRRLFATPAGSADIISWELATGRLHRADQRASSGVQVLAVSPDGSILASGDQNNVVQFRHTRTLVIFATLHCVADVVALAFSPDGTLLASGDLAGGVRLWDVATARQLYQLDGQTARAEFLSFTPDGANLVSASTLGGPVVVWKSR